MYSKLQYSPWPVDRGLSVASVGRGVGKTGSGRSVGKTGMREREVTCVHEVLSLGSRASFLECFHLAHAWVFLSTDRERVYLTWSSAWRIQILDRDAAKISYIVTMNPEPDHEECIPIKQGGVTSVVSVLPSATAVKIWTEKFL